jgi:hypothetical protein
MAEYHLAQINIARLRAPIDDPLTAEFVAGLEPTNALAEGSPGFVWRLQTEDGDATSIQAYDDELVIVNMSVWKTADHLFNYVYRSGHVDYRATATVGSSGSAKHTYACGGWPPVSCPLLKMGLPGSRSCRPTAPPR